jgi:hypothetical protein
MRGPPSGAIQPSIVTMEPTPCVTTAPWRPRLNINRDSGSNTGGSGGGLFQQTQMFGRLNTPGWPDDHNLAVTTSVDSDEDEGQSFGISRDLPLFCTGLFCPSLSCPNFARFARFHGLGSAAGADKSIQEAARTALRTPRAAHAQAGPSTYAAHRFHAFAEKWATPYGRRVKISLPKLSYDCPRNCPVVSSPKIMNVMCPQTSGPQIAFPHSTVWSDH